MENNFGYETKKPIYVKYLGKEVQGSSSLGSFVGIVSGFDIERNELYLNPYLSFENLLNSDGNWKPYPKKHNSLDKIVPLSPIFLEVVTPGYMDKILKNYKKVKNSKSKKSN